MACTELATGQVKTQCGVPPALSHTFAERGAGLPSLGWADRRPECGSVCFPVHLAEVLDPTDHQRLLVGMESEYKIGLVPNNQTTFHARRYAVRARTPPCRVLAAEAQAFGAIATRH